MSCSDELEEELEEDEEDEELEDEDEDELTDEELLVALEETELEVALDPSLELTLVREDSRELLVVPQATMNVRKSGSNNSFFFMRIPPTEYDFILAKILRFEYLKGDSFFKRKNQAMTLGFISLF